tara:strand:- start:3640 stop:4008 length:369 start_codon:yes stop_codon:yes gene_type:complete
MAHFAKVQNGKVLRVIVADQAFVDAYVDGVPGKWIQTSYNTRHGKHYDPKTGKEDDGTPLRYNFASLGGHYDKDADAFYAEQPFASWTLNKSTFEWEPPTALPTDGKAYRWIEESKSWVEIP